MPVLAIKVIDPICKLEFLNIFFIFGRGGYIGTCECQKTLILNIFYAKLLVNILLHMGP